jgi:hypothetical protein
VTGPEHYKQAENCLAGVAYEIDAALALLAEAQVHATLALAASNADPFLDGAGWQEVLR